MSPGPLLWHPRPQAPLQRHVVSTGWTPRLLEFHCTDQARDHAHHSDLWQLPVKELKARLTALGTDLRGVTEKTELIMLLEEYLVL
eukprot:symbB.v1.2.003628.t1/scaffold203.1/size271217/20